MNFEFTRKKFIWLVLWGLILSLCLTCVDRLSQSNPSPTAIQLELPPRKDFRIALISDLNSQYGSTEYEPEVTDTIALLPQWQPDLVLSGGDAIAGQKLSLTKAEINAMWQAFDRQITAPLRQQKVPYAFTIGNHDGSGAVKNNSPLFQQERELARAYWLNHQAKLGWEFVDRGDFPFYYSFQINDLFFLVWDASTHIISKTQLAWIERALKSDTARQAKTKIAIGHLPLYPITAAKNQPGEYLANAGQLRSLLERSKIAVYFSGHQHAYYPGKKGNLELLNAGALGQGARQLIGSDLAPYPSFTIVDIDLAKSEFIYTTYNAKTWKVVNIDSLPTAIAGENGTIFRLDL